MTFDLLILCCSVGGGTAVVYEAEDLQAGKHVALKVRPQIKLQAGVVALFRCCVVMAGSHRSGSDPCCAVMA